MTITMTEDKIKAGGEFILKEMLTSAGEVLTPAWTDALARKLQAEWQDTEAVDATTVDPFWHLAVDHTTAR